MVPTLVERQRSASDHHPNGAHIGGAHLGGWSLAVGRQVGRIIVLDTGGGGLREPVQKVVPLARLVDNPPLTLWTKASLW